MINDSIPSNNESSRHIQICMYCIRTAHIFFLQILLILDSNAFCNIVSPVFFFRFSLMTFCLTQHVLTPVSYHISSEPRYSIQFICHVKRFRYSMLMNMPDAQQYIHNIIHSYTAVHIKMSLSFVFRVSCVLTAKGQFPPY